MLFDCYTSDLHFGHANVIQYSSRPFSDVEEMNRKLIRNWNDVVDPGQRVLIVGDMFFGPFDKAEEIMSQLNGKKSLVLGNHDRTSSRMLKLGLELVVDKMTLSIAGQIVRVSHYPYPGMRSREVASPIKDAPQYWRREKNQVEYLIHGHTHSTKRREGRAIHVGVDAWAYCPVTHDEIVDLINEEQEEREDNDR